jgi:hypothetical protein
LLDPFVRGGYQLPFQAAVTEIHLNGESATESVFSARSDDFVPHLVPRLVAGYVVVDLYHLRLRHRPLEGYRGHLPRMYEYVDCHGSLLPYWRFQALKRAKYVFLRVSAPFGSLLGVVVVRGAEFPLFAEFGVRSVVRDLFEVGFDVRVAV